MNNSAGKKNFGEVFGKTRENDGGGRKRSEAKQTRLLCERSVKHSNQVSAHKTSGVNAVVADITGELHVLRSLFTGFLGQKNPSYEHIHIYTTHLWHLNSK